MTARQGFNVITTLVVASMIATSPFFMKCKALPAVDFSNFTIQFRFKKIQSFYDCLCGDNVEACFLRYQTFFVQDVSPMLSTNGTLSSIPREVTFSCDRPLASVSRSKRYRCSLQQDNDTSVLCGCAAGCPVSHINETHSTKCRNKCVNIIWKGCYVEYEDFKKTEAPLLNSCSQPTSPTFQTLVTAESNETFSMTEENPVSTYETRSTTYETLTTTYENPVASDKSTFTIDSVTAYGNLDTAIKNNATTNENSLTNSGISTKFDSTSENFSDSQTLVIAVGVSGGILVILIVSAIIAIFCWRSKREKTNEAMNVEPDPVNPNQKNNDYWSLDPEYTYSSSIRISGNMCSPVSKSFDPRYDNLKNTNDSYKSSVNSETYGVTEEKKVSPADDFVKNGRPIIPEATDDVLSGKRGKEIIDSDDLAYRVCYEEIEPNDTGFTLYSLTSLPAGHTCLKEGTSEAKSGHLNRETMDEKSTELGQNAKNSQVLVTCNHDSQPLPEINGKARKQKDQGEDDDNYAKIGQIGEMDTGDLSAYDCESQSFSSLMERQNGDQGEADDKVTKINKISNGGLAKNKPEPETCSGSKEEKNAGKDEERPADNIYTGLGQTEEINDSDLATYDQESQTFSRLMDGNIEEKGKDGNNSAEIIHIKEPQSTQLKDEKSGDKDKDDMNDNYTEIGQITDSQSSSKVEDERDKERDEDDMNDNYAEIVQMKGPQPSFKLKDAKSEERDANDLNDTYAEIGEVTEMIDNGPARHDYELQSLSYLIDEKTPENNTDGPTVNTYARLGQKEEADDSDLATYNHESETFSKLIDENDEEKDKDSRHDQDSTLAQTKKPAVYELAICNHEPESVSNQMKERMV
ncbi:hypothetical protein PoB_004673000 [Plakobranchus ocellatus]|uniref:Uncharacterized protein n=1 Tax=Plakobranchus ocellatus TaxID=259542 RepID=A0AAV4BL94_9GAST|nr:hypothetical protein PoB_004673000 [Plakobranchus ocellatus]